MSALPSRSAPLGAARQRIAFRAVNRPGAPDYDPDLQRHHLLRRRQLDSRRARLALNRRDPLGAGRDFAGLDAMAEALWGATQAEPQ